MGQKILPLAEGKFKKTYLTFEARNYLWRRNGPLHISTMHGVRHGSDWPFFYIKRGAALKRLHVSTFARTAMSY